MANKSRKYCASFPCRNMAEPGQAYCRDHQPTRATKETDPFYLSPSWRRFRNWYAANHPFCQMCEEQDGVLTTLDVVDHIVELKDGGARLSEENVMSLCHRHHNMKSAEEKHKRNTPKNHQQSSGLNRSGSIIES